jgi:putative phosphoesterase
VDIAIISDTHLPRGQRALPDGCVQALRAADLIIHAGDFSRLSVLRDLQALGRRVIAVHGNVDDADVRAALPETELVWAERTRIGVVHDAGPATGRVERLRRRFPEADAVIFGHSHVPLHETGRDGLQIFNPGSPTERRRAPHHTMGLARVNGTALTFRLVTLD